MSLIAIIGGGISGLTAAYELERARLAGAAIDWQLYEASGRLGGIIDTTRIATLDGEYILEGGPDAWVTEKPWARELAIELGLEGELVACSEGRRTWIHVDGRLQPIPSRMRLMVPEDLSALEDSPLFSPEAKQAYAAELTRSAELRAHALDRPGNEHADESVATFVRRHFGHEVLTRLAAPLLSGVFGGDVEALSVRAVMPQFVSMEREHGSLIAALQSRRAAHGEKPEPAIFTSLRHGMASLTEALVARLPTERLHLNAVVHDIAKATDGWLLGTTFASHDARSERHHFVNQVLLATPLDATRKLLARLDAHASRLLPREASSATLVCLAWPAKPFTDPKIRPGAPPTIPPGFGFLVPPASHSLQETCHPLPKDCHPERSEGSAVLPDQNSSPRRPTSLSPPGPLALGPWPSPLLAATFVNQKFPHRAPVGSHVIRAFFGAGSAEHFNNTPDTTVAEAALTQLRSIMGPLPDPDPALTVVRRWPRSLPQYEVGHLDRMAELDRRVAALPNLHLLGNSYRGVGLPDLIRDARALGRRLASS